MGRHTHYLSDDGTMCTLCDKELDKQLETCLCCGTGSMHTCWKYPKCQEFAIGNNKGCDFHHKKGDKKVPKEFPKCKHKIAYEKRVYGYVLP